jgi:hypothetical protein
VKPQLPAGREYGELSIAMPRLYCRASGDSRSRFQVVTSLTSGITAAQLFVIDAGIAPPWRS